MHRTTLNELRLNFSIALVSPLSIQERNADTMSRFVRAVHPEANKPTVYIPGATLKGALRSAAEHVVRGAGLHCCDLERPCLTTGNAGNTTSNTKRDGVAIYRALCPLCRIFGSKMMRSHLTVTDCFPAEPLDPTENRRASNSDETIQGETFYGTLSLRNFERWQVGLLALLLTRINLADVQIGGNRAAGMGCVQIRYHGLTAVYPGMAPDARQQESIRGRLQGVGQLLGAGNPYGFAYPDIAEAVDLPGVGAYEAGFGFVAIQILPGETSIQNGVEESSEGTENGEAGREIEESQVTPGDPLEKVHGLIDNVLTQQAIAWGSYVRTHRKP
jgi:CRISPR/Cas system CSM-associated protein Csm3 (group 7 of RAMP superfamily)